MKWLLLLLPCIHFTAFAEVTVPSGSFGLDFTDDPKTAAFTIEVAVSNINVKSIGEQTDYHGMLMTTDAKKKLWDKLAWSDNVFETAQCISFEREAICHVDTEQRKSAPALDSLKSDYFHYDPMNGVVTAFPLN